MTVGVDGTVYKTHPQQVIMESQSHSFMKDVLTCHGRKVTVGKEAYQKIINETKFKKGHSLDQIQTDL